MTFHRFYSGSDWSPPDKVGFQIDDIVIEDKSVSDFYSVESKYLVEWFFKERITQGLNGPILIPLIDFPKYDRWLGNCWDYLYSLLLKYQSNK
jgi:hypothetical protein